MTYGESGYGERIATLEQRANERDAQLRRMEDKIDTLVSAFNMGRGAWLLAARTGGLLIMVLMAFAWSWDRFLSRWFK